MTESGLKKGAGASVRAVSQHICSTQYCSLVYSRVLPQRADFTEWRHTSAVPNSTLLLHYLVLQNHDSGTLNQWFRHYWLSHFLHTLADDLNWILIEMHTLDDDLNWVLIELHTLVDDLKSSIIEVLSKGERLNIHIWNHCTTFSPTSKVFLFKKKHKRFSFWTPTNVTVPDVKSTSNQT